MGPEEIIIGEIGLDRSGSGWGQLVGCCECGNESSCSIKYRQFHE